MNRQGNYRGLRVPPVVRFTAKLDTSSECWTLDAHHDKDGYPTFTVGGRSIRGARFAYEAFVGPISDGLCVCHTCDNPACVRPAHLWLGTAGENNTDRSRKGRDARHSRGGRRNAARTEGGRFACA